jgi:hypothetical protein
VVAVNGFLMRSDFISGGFLRSNHDSYCCFCSSWMDRRSGADFSPWNWAPDSAALCTSDEQWSWEEDGRPHKCRLEIQILNVQILSNFFTTSIQLMNVGGISEDNWCDVSEFDGGTVSFNQSLWSERSHVNRIVHSRETFWMDRKSKTFLSRKSKSLTFLGGSIGVTLKDSGERIEIFFEWGQTNHPREYWMWDRRE